MLKAFLQSLPEAAKNPLAFAGYLVLIVAWIITVVYSQRSKRLFSVIKDLPEQDRIKAIANEYKTVPAEGITAKDWLNAKQANYRLIRLGAIVLVVLVILGLSAYIATEVIQKQTRH